MIVNHLADAEEAAAVVRDVEAMGGWALAVGADVSQEGEVRELFRTARDALGGPLDLLVNNAGVEASHPLLEMDPRGLAEGSSGQPHRSLPLASSPERSWRPGRQGPPT